MLTLLKSIKAKIPFIWSLIEWLNGVFIRFIYNKRLRIALSIIFNTHIKDSNRYVYRAITIEDISLLHRMLLEQPCGFDQYFKPHEFDYNTLCKFLKNSSFLMFGVFNEDKIVGYFFLRLFANGKAFRGKMVDFRYQGRGIAKKMGEIMTVVAMKSGFRLFATISKNNISSFASSKAVNNIVILKELDDGYVYVEYLEKK